MFCTNCISSIQSCIKAFLLETNENLITDPNLLLSKVSILLQINYTVCYPYFPYFKPLGEGYIAIVMSKLDDADKVCSELLSEEQYKDALMDSTAG